VPDSVGHALRQGGHEVILLREQLAPDSPDPLIAAVSEMNNAVLVSLDGDFKSIAPRIASGAAALADSVALPSGVASRRRRLAFGQHCL
jgi:predicted nuclease of predicted toxin-antitoxin system